MITDEPLEDGDIAEENIPMCPWPTNAEPGSAAKIAVLTGRYEARQHLFHPCDHMVFTAHEDGPLIHGLTIPKRDRDD